eukprot:8202815-Pyramimonas_sp.AAC.1
MKSREITYRYLSAWSSPISTGSVPLSLFSLKSLQHAQQFSLEVTQNVSHRSAGTSRFSDTECQFMGVSTHIIVNDVSKPTSVGIVPVMSSSRIRLRVTLLHPSSALTTSLNRSLARFRPKR